MRTALLFVALPLVSWADEAEVRAVAEKYLAAITGRGDERGRELLLGGVPMDAQLLALENGRIVEAEPLRREEGDLAQAKSLMAELDGAGRKALTALMNAEQTGDDLTMTEISQEDAQKLLQPTKEKASRFVKAHPLLAYCARVGKEVYWHPKNPIRPLLQSAGSKGRYVLEFQRFTVESKEGPRQSIRRWPLRVLRFRAGQVDTGWRVLPASDWSPE